MLAKLDISLLDELFTEFAHIIQREYGKTNFWLARCAACLGWLSSGVYILLAWENGKILSEDLTNWFSPLLLWLLFVGYAAFRERKWRMNPCQANDLRQKYRVQRCACTATVVLSLPMLFVGAVIMPLDSVLASLITLSAWAALYFISCTPVPRPRMSPVLQVVK